MSRGKSRKTRKSRKGRPAAAATQREETAAAPATAPVTSPETAAPPSAEGVTEPVTTVHGIPGADRPVTFTGDMALPGFEDLSFGDLAQLAGMAGIGPSGEDPDVLEGAVLQQEVAEARRLLAEAEDRGEGVLDLAHAVAYLDSVHKAIGRQIKRTRDRAEKVNAAAQLVHGTKSVAVTLDDGGPPVCTVHIQDPEPDLVWDDKAVLAYTRKHSPHNVFDEPDPRALEVPEVVAFLRTFYPEYMTSKVRPAWRTLLQERLNDQGQLIDAETGEVFQLATVRPPRRTGQFRLTYAKAKNGLPEGKERIAAMFRKGLLGDVLTLGAGPDDDPDAATDGDDVKEPAA